MKTKLKNIKTFLLFFLVTSCASYRPLVVVTNPTKAKVSIYNSEQKKFIFLGNSPLSMEKDKIEKAFNPSGDFVALKIEKSGFIVEHLLYDLGSKPKVEYLIDLKEIQSWADDESEVSSKLANDVAKKIQKINKDIIRNNLSTAISKINKLIESYPKAHIFYDIKGSIQILKNENFNAYSSFNKSLSLNPDNSDTQKAVRSLEIKLKGEKK